MNATVMLVYNSFLCYHATLHDTYYDLDTYRTLDGRRTRITNDAYVALHSPAYFIFKYGVFNDRGNSKKHIL